MSSSSKRTFQAATCTAVETVSQHTPKQKKNRREMVVELLRAMRNVLRGYEAWSPLSLKKLIVNETLHLHCTSSVANQRVPVEVFNDEVLSMDYNFLVYPFVLKIAFVPYGGVNTLVIILNVTNGDNFNLNIPDFEMDFLNDNLLISNIDDIYFNIQSTLRQALQSNKISTNVPFPEWYRLQPEI